MTTEKQIIALAMSRDSRLWLNEHGLLFCWTNDTKTQCYRVTLSELPFSLDYLHEVEKSFTKEQAFKYNEILVKVTITIDKLFPKQCKYPADGYLYHASKEQKLEAMIKTLDLWKD